MTQQTPAPADVSAATSSAPASGTPRSLREYVTSTLINTIPPLATYYALRAFFDVTPYLALVGAIVVAILQGIFNMVRNRKFEPMNGLVIVAAGASLAVAFTTKNPRIVQLTELLPATLMVWSCLVSGLLRKPTSKTVAAVIVPRLAEPALPARGWTDQDITDWHRLHIKLCVRLGFLLSLFPALAAFLIFTLPVDVSQVLLAVIGSALLIVSIAIAVTLLRNFVRDRDRQAAQR